jgi:hypothetical protein
VTGRTRDRRSFSTCPAGHYFSGPIESLNWDSTDKHDPGTAGAGSRGGRDSLQGFNHGRYGGGGLALRDLPAEPTPRISRPNTAPAYYLGRPARLWITAIGPCPRQAASRPMQAVTDRGERTPSRSPGRWRVSGCGAQGVGEAGGWLGERVREPRQDDAPLFL